VGNRGDLGYGPAISGDGGGAWPIVNVDCGIGFRPACR
jgi:hypothetical protein